MPKELPSIITQIGRCYTANRSIHKNVLLNILSFDQAWELETLKRFPTYKNWKSDNIVFSESDVKNISESPERICYLTADSSNILEHVDSEITYIIGGIVDRNRHKKLCYDKATKLGFNTAQLPIKQFISLGSRSVLTINHVFEIMVEYLNNGNDWKEAFFKVIRNINLTFSTSKGC